MILYRQLRNILVILKYHMCGQITVLNNRKIRSAQICSKDCYLGPPPVLDVLVDIEDEQEDKEEARAAKEVPDVVPDINSW